MGYLIRKEEGRNQLKEKRELVELKEGKEGIGLRYWIPRNHNAKFYFVCLFDYLKGLFDRDYLKGLFDRDYIKVSYSPCQVWNL